MGHRALFCAFILIPFMTLAQELHSNEPVTHEDQLCAAYLKTASAKIGIGSTWSSKICDDHSSSNFLNCQIKDSLLSSSLGKCSAGEVFSFNESRCVASGPTECPVDWLQEQLDSANASFSLHEHANEGQHGCIIDDCMRCVCREALKNPSEPGQTYINDPRREENDRFLQCHQNSVICHPCPKGLVWDCQRKTCANNGSCPDIPKTCFMECDRIPPVTTITTITKTTSIVTTVTASVRKITNTTSSTRKPHIISISVTKSPTTITKIITDHPTSFKKTIISITRKGYHPLETSITRATDVCTSISEKNCSTSTRHVSSTESSSSTASPISVMNQTSSNHDHHDSTAKPFSVRDHDNDGQHGCIDFVIDDCKRCICKEALAGSGSDHTHVNDPRRLENDQFLQCYGDAVICHSCPRGLMWDCQRETCAPQGFCPDIPQTCFGVCGRKPPVTTVTTITITTTVVTTTVTIVKNVTNTTDANAIASTTTSTNPSVTTKAVTTDPSTAGSSDYTGVGDYSIDPTVTDSEDCCKESATNDCSNTTRLMKQSLTPMGASTTAVTHLDKISTISTNVTNTSIAVPTTHTTVPTTPTTVPYTPSTVPTTLTTILTTSTTVPTPPSTVTTTPSTVTTTPLTVTSTPYKSCPDFEVTTLHQCICEEALNSTTDGSNSALVCDPFSEERYVVCQNDKIICEKCPGNMKWNSEEQRCSLVRKCLLIPPKCQTKTTSKTITSPKMTTNATTELPSAITLSPMTTTATALPPTTTTALPPKTTTTPLFKSFFDCNVTLLHHCICEEALNLTTDGSNSVLVCDPYSEERYVVCQNDKIICEKCPGNMKWNSEERRCSPMMKCLPIPPQCRPTTTNTTITRPTTTTPMNTKTTMLSPMTTTTTTLPPTTTTLPPTTTTPTTTLPPMTTTPPTTTTPTTTTTTLSSTTTTIPYESCPNWKITPLHRCICEEARSATVDGSNSALVCDPHSEERYVVCQPDKLICENCPGDMKWNSDEQRCSQERKCLPIPSKCRPTTTSSTVTRPTTTSNTTNLPPTTTTTSTIPVVTTTPPVSSTSPPTIISTTTLLAATTTTTTLPPTTTTTLPSTTTTTTSLPPTTTTTTTLPSTTTTTLPPTTTTTLPPTTTTTTTLPPTTTTTLPPTTTTTTTLPPTTTTTTTLPPTTTTTTTTPPPTTITTTRKPWMFVMRNLRKCVCRETIKYSKSHTGVHYVCDPQNEFGFLICQSNRVFQVSCPGRFMWNSRISSCSRVRECAPIPYACLPPTTTTRPLTTTTTTLPPTTKATTTTSTTTTSTTTTSATTSVPQRRPVTSGDTCINCTIAPLHRCVCEEALRYAVDKSLPALLCDPLSMGQFLVCENQKVFRESCPVGTYWNSKEQTCMRTRVCLPIPNSCKPTTTSTTTTAPTKTTTTTTTSTTAPPTTNIATSTPTTLPPTTAATTSLPPTTTTTTSIPTTTTTTPTLPPTTTTTTFLPTTAPITAKQRCSCEQALKNSKPKPYVLHSMLICDPDSEDQFLVCQKGSVIREACPAGRKWNSVVQTCSKERICQPIPLECAESKESVAEILPSSTKDQINTRVPITVLTPPIHSCVCSENGNYQWGPGPWFLCDPLDDDKYLVCQKDQVVTESCTGGKMWNFEKQSCSHTKSCLPVPSKCRSTVTASTTEDETTTISTTLTPTTTPSVPTTTPSVPTTTPSVPTTTTLAPTTTTSAPTATTQAPTATTPAPTATTPAPTATTPAPTTTTPAPTTNTLALSTTASTTRAPITTTSTTSSTTTTTTSTFAEVKTAIVYPVSSASTATPMQQCLCAEALMTIPEQTLPAFLCDPHSQEGVVICHKSKVLLDVCPGGLKWNYEQKSCFQVRKCLPRPLKCLVSDYVRKMRGPHSLMTF